MQLDIHNDTDYKQLPKTCHANNNISNNITLYSVYIVLPHVTFSQYLLKPE